MSTEPFLRVENLRVNYGPAQVLFDVSLDIEEGSIHAVLGSNGAGKSTMARALSGLVPPAGGTVRFDGRDITRWPPHRIRRAGLIYLPEGRGVFPALTVLDNVRMATRAVPRAERADAMDKAFELFPVLGERRKQQAATLSGGEQQMLSLARALAVQPRLVIADELSLGLAPKLVDLVFDSLDTARKAGVTILLIEQFVHRALGFADHCAILQRGELNWSGPASAAEEEVLASYLGSAAGETLV